MRILFILDGQHACIVVLAFLGVEEHVELASEYLFSHEFALDVRRPSQSHIRVDVKLFGHVFDAARQTVGHNCLRTLALVVKELLVIVMR